MDEKEYKECLKIHGYVWSDDDSDDGSKTKLDDVYEAFKPAPIVIDPQRHKIIEIGTPLDCQFVNAGDNKLTKSQRKRRRKQLLQQYQNGWNGTVIEYVESSDDRSGLKDEMVESVDWEQAGNDNNKTIKKKSFHYGTCLKNELVESVDLEQAENGINKIIKKKSVDDRSCLKDEMVDLEQAGNDTNTIIKKKRRRRNKRQKSSSEKETQEANGDGRYISSKKNLGGNKKQESNSTDDIETEGQEASNSDIGNAKTTAYCFDISTIIEEAVARCIIDAAVSKKVTKRECNKDILTCSTYKSENGNNGCEEEKTSKMHNISGIFTRSGVVTLDEKKSTGLAIISCLKQNVEAMNYIVNNSTRIHQHLSVQQINVKTGFI